MKLTSDSHLCDRKQNSNKEKKTGDSDHRKLIEIVEREKSIGMLRTTRRRTANRITFSFTSLSTFILMVIHEIYSTLALGKLDDGVRPVHQVFCDAFAATVFAT